MRTQSAAALASLALLPLSLAQLLIPEAPYAWYVGKAAIGVSVTAGTLQAEFVFGAYSVDSPVTIWGVVGGMDDGVSVGYGIYAGATCDAPGGFFTNTPVTVNGTTAPGDLSTKYGALSSTTPSISSKQDSTLFPRQILGLPFVIYNSVTMDVLGCALLRNPVLATTTIYSKAIGGAVVNFVSINGKAPTWIYGQFMGISQTAKLTWGVYEGSVGGGYAGAQCSSVTNFTTNGDLTSRFGTLTGSTGKDGVVAGTFKVNVQDIALAVDDLIGKTLAILDNTTLVGCGTIVAGATPLIDTTTTPANSTGGTNPLPSSSTRSAGGAGSTPTGTLSSSSSSGSKPGASVRQSTLSWQVVGAVVSAVVWAAA